MAKRKKATRRRRRTLSGGGAVRRRRSRPRSKGFLSDMFNPTIAASSAKQTLSAAAGGMGAVVTNRALLPPDTRKLTRVAMALGVGFLAASFGMPNVGAGYTGGLMALTFQSGMLADDDDNANFADQDSLQDKPLYLDENDQPMVLEEGQDGTAGYRYLSDEEISILEEAGAFQDFEVVT